jgi:hypothetical protein
MNDKIIGIFKNGGKYRSKIGFHRDRSIYRVSGDISGNGRSVDNCPPGAVVHFSTSSALVGFFPANNESYGEFGAFSSYPIRSRTNRKQNKKRPIKRGQFWSDFKITLLVTGFFLTLLCIGEIVRVI